MTEEGVPEPQPTESDLVKSLKEEFDRQMNEMREQIANLTSERDVLKNAMLQTATLPKPDPEPTPEEVYLKQVETLSQKTLTLMKEVYHD